jgi:VCBS repeat-containing protein
MAKLIRVWDGTAWQSVGAALPNTLSVDGTQTLTNKTISGASNTLTNIPNNALSNSSITVNGSAVSLGGSVTIVTGPASSAVSSNITMAANNNYFVNTSAARTLTLPASPTLGDTIAIYDASGTAATNNITIARNGSNINGVADNAIIDVDQAGSVFIYTGSTVGWRFD